VRAEKTNFQFVKDGNDFRSLEMGEVRIEAVDESGTLLAGIQRERERERQSMRAALSSLVAALVQSV